MVLYKTRDHFAYLKTCVQHSDSPSGNIPFKLCIKPFRLSSLGLKNEGCFHCFKSCQNIFPAKVNLAVLPKCELYVNFEKISPENYNE